jgi:sec-independent protein translocase protein TatB
MLPEVGATELLVIAAIALIVVGPKDLPVLMRRVGQWVARMRSMAMEFRSSFDELARQSELDELRREVEAMRRAAHDPVAVAGEAVGLGDVHSEINGAFAGVPFDPHGAPPPSLPYEAQATAEPAAEPAAERAPGAAQPEDSPKPKARRKRAKKAASEGPAAPEAQS